MIGAAAFKPSTHGRLRAGVPKVSAPDVAAFVDTDRYAPSLMRSTWVAALGGLLERIPAFTAKAKKEWEGLS